jgi:exonuclease SbcD
MKFIHISDLHIGKRVHEKSLIPEQEHILDQICDIVSSHIPDAVLIAGDIYDKAIPSGEAVLLFDDFLTRLSSLCAHVFVISGNHDSAERMAFGSRLMDSKGIHLSPVYNGSPEAVTLTDIYGDTDVYMLPYIRPAHVRHYVPEEEKDGIDSYDAAVRKAVELMDIDRSKRNVLITHQFVTGAVRSESEDVNVGGLDNVDASAFDNFDYVALGHLHRPQDCADERIRYSGSPLKYSFSEVNDDKSVTVVTLHEKGRMERELIPLVPLHDWHDIKGTYEELTSRSFYGGTALTEDFVRITLTDEQDIPDAIGKLRTIYHNLLELRYDNKRTRAGIAAIEGSAGAEEKTPMELFNELYVNQNGDSLTQEQEAYLMSIMENIWEGEK